MKYAYSALFTHVEAKRKSYAKAIIFTAFIVAIVGGCIYSANVVRARQSKSVSVQLSGVVRNEGIEKVLAAPCRQTDEGVYDCTSKETKEHLYHLQTKTIKYQATFKATVTGYTSRVQETDGSPEISANGKNIWKLHKQGIHTCASNDYPFGTKLTIQGLGTCVVNDRMNRRYTGTGRIDYYFGYDLKAALNHGIKTMNVSL